MIVEIVRLESSVDHGTFGIMRINKHVFCNTLEPYDRENKTSISSIPTGQYTCKKIGSKKFGTTFEIMDVTDRTNILFHRGNVDENTEGCILLGNGVGLLGNDRAVLNSKDTFNNFISILSHDHQFHLTISEMY